MVAGRRWVGLEAGSGPRFIWPRTSGVDRWRVVTSEGQRHDSVWRSRLWLDRMAVDRIGLGRPRTRPDWVLADNAYSSKQNRAYLAGRKIKVAIPIKDDQVAARRRKGRAGGPPAGVRHCALSRPQRCGTSGQQAPRGKSGRHPLRQA